MGGASSTQVRFLFQKQATLNDWYMSMKVWTSYHKQVKSKELFQLQLSFRRNPCRTQPAAIGIMSSLKKGVRKQMLRWHFRAYCPPAVWCWGLHHWWCNGCWYKVSNVILKTFTGGELGWYDCRRDCINRASVSGVWEQCRNNNYKDNGIGCMLLSTIDTLEKDNEKLGELIGN